MAAKTSKGVFDALARNWMPIVIIAQAFVIAGWVIAPHVCR
jgi:hypothetical protein